MLHNGTLDFGDFFNMTDDSQKITPRSIFNAVIDTWKPEYDQMINKDTSAAIKRGEMLPNGVDLETLAKFARPIVNKPIPIVNATPVVHRLPAKTLSLQRLIQAPIVIEAPPMRPQLQLTNEPLIAPVADKQTNISPRVVRFLNERKKIRELLAERFC